MTSKSGILWSITKASLSWLLENTAWTMATTRTVFLVYIWHNRHHVVNKAFLDGFTFCVYLLAINLEQYSTRVPSTLTRRNLKTENHSENAPNVFYPHKAEGISKRNNQGSFSKNMDREFTLIIFFEMFSENPAFFKFLQVEERLRKALFS